jgi:hypothetical protein
MHQEDLLGIMGGGTRPDHGDRREGSPMSRAREATLAKGESGDDSMTEPVVVPHWLAEKLKQQHGSLEAFRELTGVKVVDDYWRQLNDESQTRINRYLSRAWKRA